MLLQTALLHSFVCIYVYICHTYIHTHIGVGDGKLIKAGGKAISNMANNFTTTMMKNTTKTVAGKTVYKSVKTVVKHVAKNFMTATAETAAISGGAWLNSKAWGVLIQ